MVFIYMKQKIALYFFRFAIALGTLICISNSANASIYTVNYTGTVNDTYLYGTAPLPDGIMVGSTINGSFSFNTDNAAPPTYIFGSCSGSCGGGEVFANFAYTSGLAHTASIAGHTWTAHAGQVGLGDSYFTGPEVQSMGVSSTPTQDGSSLNFSLTKTGGSDKLFPDVNSLNQLVFGNAASGSGWIQNSDYYIAFSVNIPVQNSAVPLPATLWMFGSGLIGLTGITRKRKAT